MLPLTLQSSYKTYKEDTNTIATWLATKAKQSTQAPGRLKGKARKKAQEASKGTTTAPAAASDKVTNVERPAYIIETKEFISLAEYIVGSSKPWVKVPVGLVKVMDRAINLRKQFGSAVGGSGNPDCGHAHFLGILEKIREVLKPYSAPPEDGPAGPEPESEALDAVEQQHISNIFDTLDLEEPSQEFLDAPGAGPAQPKTEKESNPKYEVETPQTREEEYLAAHCLLEDVTSIRRFLCALWKNYEEGMELYAVSITVNTAIDFVRTLELDMSKRFPAKTDYESITMIFYMAQCLHRGIEPEQKQQPGDLFNLAVYDLAEDIMLPTYSILSSLQDVIRNGTVRQYKPEYLEHRDRTTHWHQKSARDKIQDDRLVMMEAFPDLVQLSMITSRNPLAKDELMRGIRQMSPGKDIPLWLVFAAQCFLDAQHELKGDISKGLDQLRQTANNIGASIDQNLQFHKTLRIVNWPKENDETFTDMLYVMEEWVGKDVQRYAAVPDGERFQLLRQYPVICGLFSFALQMRYQEIQVTFINAWGSLMYTAQLYHAVRQEKLLPDSKIWKDIELVISLQGSDKFFVGEPPKEPEDYLKRFMLSMGYSAALFANNRRKKAHAVSTKGPRQLMKLCAVGQLFAGRYCNNDAAVAWTTETMKPIIEAKLDDDGDDEEGSKKSKKVKQSTSGALLRKPRRSGSSIPTTDFLLDLANALHAEMIESSVDYLRIHRFSWMLLRSVNEACKPRLLEIYGGGYLEREDQLPFVVGYIFMSASATSQIAGLLIPKKEGVEVSNRLLMTAAQVIGEVMDSGAGAIETKMLEQKMGAMIDFRAYC
ncbi:MAG: hypothetical protein Q9207_006703 [Kuettlingeria erythrocarpa]